MASIVFLADSKNREYSSVVFPDVIFNISHSLNNTITSYAIEKAQDGTYNAKINNNVITITGHFASYSRYGDSDGRNTPITDEIDASGTTLTRRKRAFDALKKYRDTKLFIDVVTGLNIYKDCLIKSIEVTEDNKTQDVLPFTISFEQPRLGSVVKEREVVITPSKADSAADVNYRQDTKKEKDKETLTERNLSALQNLIFEEENGGTE